MGGTYCHLCSWCIFLLLVLYWLALTSILIVGCGISILVCMFFVLRTLFVHALCGNPVPDAEEETTIFVYAGDIAPLYEATDEKKNPDVVPAVENRTESELILPC